jgi:sugar lactone lactonase YvrE
VFLEGPRWRDDRLWLSDMHGHRVVTLTETGTVEEVARIDTRPSGLGFLPDGTPLVVSMADSRVYRLTPDGPALHADLGAVARFDINDMIVDADGRAFVGCFGFDHFGGGAFAKAPLIRVDPDGAVSIAAEDMAFPNGMVITQGSGGARHLIVAETWGQCLTAFDLSPSGDLSNRRVWADVAPHHPDGICLDAHGAIWVSSFTGGAFLRVREGGAVTHRIDVGDRHAVACQLGGADGRTLFCLTSQGSTADMVAGRAQAWVSTTRVEMPGAGSP